MAAPASLKAASRTGVRDAAAAAAFLAGACAWTFLAAAVSGGSSGRAAAMVAASAASLVLAALVSPGRPWLVPGLVVAAAAILAVAAGGDILTDRPERGPFGYANATGGFYLQATVAAFMVAVSSSHAAIRWIGVAATVAFAGITLATGSAAAAGLLILPAAGFVLSRLRLGRRAVLGFAALFGLVLIGTIVVGVSAQETVDGSRFAGIVDERRAALWHQAVTAVGENPLTGVGPEGFSQITPIALSDGDARWAHNGFLQFGAETGIPGMGMLVAAFVALFATFARQGEGDALTVLGAAALAAFGIGASVDYLMHFPAVPLAAAALAGASISRTNT